MVHWWILGACLSNQRRKLHNTEDVDNGYLKECREFHVDLHCNTFKIRFRAVYTQAYGGACRRDRTRKTHGCQTRTPSTFFFWSEKKGGFVRTLRTPLATCLPRSLVFREFTSHQLGSSSPMPGPPVDTAFMTSNGHQRTATSGR